MAERADLEFESGGRRCRGWLYRPSGEGALPCVVMAHGFATLKEARLDAYAERFCAAGLGALVFDYRHFGASDGEPRQYVNVRRQHADWRAAIERARGLDWVDPDRIALWGSSFSGGHVVAVGSRDPRIAAVVAQAPHASGFATLANTGPWRGTRLLLAAARDKLGSLLRRPPRYLPTVGPPGSFAAMTSPDALPGLDAMYGGGDWPNFVTARSTFRVGLYNPGRRAAKLRCPLLVLIADRDEVTPVRPARKMARRAPQSELLAFDCEHFTIYLGEWFERGVAAQTAFLQRALASQGPRAGTTPVAT
jgi:dienelactone hydrolase